MQINKRSKDFSWQLLFFERYYQEIFVSSFFFQDEISNDKSIDFLFHHVQRDFVTLSQLTRLGESRVTKLCSGYVFFVSFYIRVRTLNDDVQRFMQISLIEKIKYKFRSNESFRSIRKISLVSKSRIEKCDVICISQSTVKSKSIHLNFRFLSSIFFFRFVIYLFLIVQFITDRD